ncbi:MAG: alpha-hydroxy-acid oxidizing protein [Desulfobacterales bacterium]|nr:alpha-hydroxy-acid oxidizing protein [Desulfobacterales bacterium]
MNHWYCSLCHTDHPCEEKPETCEVCGADPRMILARETVPESLDQVRDLARKKLKGICAAYPSCDGNFDKVCQREAYGKPIGLGGAGAGVSFRNNVAALQQIKLNMSVIGSHFEPQTRCDFLGIPLAFPVLPASTAGMERYNDAVDETQFCRSVIRGAREAGSMALRGDTWFYNLDRNPALDALELEGGHGIPIFKPRSQDVLKQLIERAETLGCRAVGVDLDGCGSTLMARHGQPVFKKSAEEIQELVSFSSLPFIAKGIMRPDEARICVEAGVACVGVSNHGGRVLDATPGTAEVLPLIRNAVGDDVALAVDGGVRTGYDVLKLLALGADVVLLGRDIIRAAVGAGSLGVRLHMEHIRNTLKKAMFMTHVRDVNRVDSDILF